MAKNYTSQERRTGRRWTLLPSRPRTYQITLEFADLGDRSDGSVLQIPHGITGYGKTVSVSGMIVNGNVPAGTFGTERSIPYTNPKNLVDGLAIDVNQSVVGIVANADWSGYGGHIILEYMLAEDM